jgi:hypothetical protein
MIRESRSISSFQLALVGVLAAALVAAAVTSRRGPAQGADAGQPPGTRQASASAARTDPPARADWPAGPLRQAAVSEYVLLSGDRGLVRAARVLLPKLARRHLPGFAVVEIKRDETAPPGPSLGWTAVPADPFDPQVLAYSARGLDALARKPIERGLPGIFLMVKAPPDEAHRALRGTVALVAEAARALHAFVADPEARAVFAVETFAHDVLERGFEGDVPVVPAHVTIHSYRTGGAGGCSGPSPSACPSSVSLTWW